MSRFLVSIGVRSAIAIPPSDMTYPLGISSQIFLKWVA
jgi:hypothetical protein